LLAVDRFAKDLHDSLEARNLSNIVDIVFVSDHGMTDTSHPTPIYIDDILGEEGMDAIEHNDGMISTLELGFLILSLSFRLAFYGPPLQPYDQYPLLPQPASEGRRGI
jgi:predicted AlkP superfamily pyrophosphatase or phosphodiesterase